MSICGFGCFPFRFRRREFGFDCACSWSLQTRRIPPCLYGEEGGSVQECRTRWERSGFETYLRRVESLSKTLYSPKVLVMPRKLWLCPDMTDKLLTGTFSLNTNKQNFAFTNVIIGAKCVTSWLTNLIGNKSLFLCTVSSISTVFHWWLHNHWNAE